MQSQRRPQLIPQEILEVSQTAMVRGQAFIPKSVPLPHTCLDLSLGARCTPPHPGRVVTLGQAALFSQSKFPERDQLSAVSHHCQQKPGNWVLQSWGGESIWTVYHSIHYSSNLSPPVGLSLQLLEKLRAAHPEPGLYHPQPGMLSLLCSLPFQLLLSFQPKWPFPQSSCMILSCFYCFISKRC